MTKTRIKTISLFELMQKYPAEGDTICYLERIRWGDKPNRLDAFFNRMADKIITYDELVS